MSTEQLYLNDSYLKTATAKVVKVEELNNQTVVYLDQTIFYAQGGGQPADRGEIIGSNGTLKVEHVSYNGGEIQHKGALTGQLIAGDKVALHIDWARHYQHTQWHTAGHIVDQAVHNVLPEVHGINGEHGIGKKLYIEFDQPISPEKISTIQAQTDQIVNKDVPISMEFVTKAEIEARHIFLPFDLPSDKKLRLVQIGQYPPMPDGGSQLKTTGESWPIKIAGIIEKNGHARVIYEVSNPETESAVTIPPILEPTGTQSLTDLTRKITALKKQFSDEPTDTDLNAKYLGKKGIFNEVAKAIRELAPTDRKQGGQLLNELKTYFENHLTGTPTQSQAWVDLTLPGLEPNVGHMHPVSQAMEEITHIFEKIGFTRVRYAEVDWDYYVFEALNMPPSHPARDEWETFFVDAPENPQKGKIVLTTHTSNGQVREMERLGSKPPIRMINMGRCYRRQQDATHTQMFHQFEGLVVDKGITIQNLKGTLDYFAKEFFGEGTKSRIRPFHFQFTEPSFEVDFSCHICNGTGVVIVNGEKTKCKFCKSGWHEVGGAGMVHPNVLKYGGIDPNEYTGFAFGWGVERTYSLKPGLQIDDIRQLYSGDLAFLEQF